MSAKPAIEPKRWDPPRATYSVPEPTPVTVRRVALPGHGEDVAIAPDGTVYTGLGDGRIVRVDDDGATTVVATVGDGRILGIEVHPDGSLVCAAADDGMFRVDVGTGALEALRAEVNGRPLVFTNNAHVLGDGTILFSESSTRFGFDWYRADFIEHSRTGSLFALSPKGEIDQLLTGLAFANGVVQTPGENSALVAETGGYAIQKVWLSGDRAGQSDPFVDGFPGMFDNLSVGPSGTIWAAVVNQRNRALDQLLPRAPVLRKLVWAIPEALQPQPVELCRIVGFDATGKVTHHFDGRGADFSFVTGVREHDGKLWLASIEHDALGVIDLPG